MKSKTFITIGFILSLIISSCEKNEENEIKISQNNTLESHETGENCMNCHVSGGSGEGLFIIAGSVYDSQITNPYPNAAIKLYADSNLTGTLIKTIEVDGKGNFFTTEDLNFGTGLYTSVTDLNGTVATMNSPIISGNCNSCHGVTTNRIWVN